MSSVRCGHCKSLAPKLKQAAKQLQDLGVKVAAVDVEPNPSVQGKFPDIRGFPTLKFLPSTNPKQAVDYNGPREADAIVEFSKQQAANVGVSLNEPVPLKTNKELYTFFGRSALDKKPALLLLDTDSESPSWLGKAAAELRRKEVDGESPEKETRELLKQAGSVTGVKAVKEGVQSLLSAIDAFERNPGQGPPVVTPGFSNDPDAFEAFGLKKTDLPALVFASVDRKGSGKYISFKGNLKSAKQSVDGVVQFVKSALPHMVGPDALAEFDSNAATLPSFPKPANVLAAEKRAAAKKAEEGAIHKITDSASLQDKCYGLSGKTCALFLVESGDADDDMAHLAKKYARDGFSFGIVSKEDASELVTGFLGDDTSLPSLAIVKTGKRPRVASASGSSIDGLLGSVVAGGVQFKRLSDGLPQWPNPGFGEDEL